MHMLPIKCLSVSRKATCVLISIPKARDMNFTRDIDAKIVALITCRVQARLIRIIEMNKTSKFVPFALAPPMPVTKKHEKTKLTNMDSEIKELDFEGGEVPETVKIRIPYSNRGLAQHP